MNKLRLKFTDVKDKPFMSQNTVEKTKYIALRRKETIANEFVELTK